MTVYAPIHVDLDVPEIKEALDAGVAAYTEGLEKGYDHVAEFDGDPFLANISGKLGERVFYKAMGLPWTGGGGFKTPDFGRLGEVRCAPCKKDRPPRGFGRLILRPRQQTRHGTWVGDDPEHYYVLVAGNVPHFVVLGWIKGADGIKVGKWEKRNDRPGAWFVEAKLLNGNMDELMRRAM